MSVPLVAQLIMLVSQISKDVIIGDGGQACRLQAWVSAPEHPIPVGLGVQMRIWVPPPHDALHADQLDHVPGMVQLG